MATAQQSEFDPSPLEKSNQLERILLSKTFKKQLKPCELLTTLVESNVSQMPIDEDTIGVRIFARRPGWLPMEDSVVRQNLTRLRKMLETYYTTEGIEDRLNVEISGYGVQFTYNLRHPVERDFRRALRYVSTDLKVAYSLLTAVLEVEPDHAEALAAWGETELWRPMAGNEVCTAFRLEEAEERARKSLGYDPGCWRAHIVMGAVHSCRLEWKKAEKSFAAALRSAPQQTAAHPWYPAFLMAVGRSEEGLDLVKTRANGPSETPWPQLTYAIFLYVARRYKEAYSVLSQERKDHKDTWQRHVIWSCLFASEQDTLQPPFIGMSLEQELPDGKTVYTGLTILEHLRRLVPEHADYRLARESFERWLDIKREVLDAPEQDLLDPSHETKICASHLAIGYMAFGQYENAVEMLKRDLENGHPLMVWLHLWPLFDPLRDRTDFKRVIAQMKLPRRKVKS